MTSNVPPVVEVVARYRGRVIDVQHVRWTPAPAVSPAGYLGAGSVLLLLGLGLGLRGLAQVEAIAACSVPPCPTPSIGAGLGVTLVALGIVPFVLGVMRWRDRARSRYTIGEAPGVDLTVALAGAREEVPLVIALEQSVIVGLPPGARGRIDGAETIDLEQAVAQGRRSIALPADGRARIEVGELCFEIVQVPPAEQTRAKVELDRLAWLSHVATALILGGWFFYLDRKPVEPLVVDEAEQLERVAKYFSSTPTPNKPKPPEPPVVAQRPPSAQKNSQPIAEPVPEPPPAPAMLVDENSGLVAPSSPTAFVRRHKHGTGRTDSEFDYDRVAGHLGDPGFIAAVEDYTVNMKEGQRHYAVTPEVNAWWAKATGGPPRMSKHFGGLDLAETERGGGVHSDKPRPEKKPSATVTLTSAARTPPPPPTQEEQARAHRLVTVEMDPPGLDGAAGIDKINLYQYARSKMAAWRTCYENGLDKHPNLGGVLKLVVVFNEKGTVSRTSVAWTTLNIGRIENCLLAAVKKWSVTPNTPKPTTAVFHLQFSSRTK